MYLAQKKSLEYLLITFLNKLYNCNEHIKDIKYIKKAMKELPSMNKVVKSLKESESKSCEVF